jgi:hypothetical protein
VPQDINSNPSVKSALAGGETQKVDKPLSPQAERTAPDSLKPSSPKGARGSPSADGAVTSPTRVASCPDPADTSSVPEPTKSPEHLPQALGLMDSGLLVSLSMVRAHLCYSLGRFCNSAHGL